MKFLIGSLVAVAAVFVALVISARDPYSIEDTTPEALQRICGVPRRNENPVVRASELTYLIFNRKNREVASTFFKDWGLIHTITHQNVSYFRARNTHFYTVEVRWADEDKFVGFGVNVKTKQDLSALSKEYGVPLQTMGEESGGWMVELHDPDGIAVQVRCGWKSREALSLGPITIFNHPQLLNRPPDSIQRIQKGPVEVWKLGHVVLGASNIMKTLAFYQKALGIVASDFQLMAKDPLPIISFNRFDLGEEITDHHSIAIASLFIPGLDHAAFEVQDIDAVGVATHSLGGKYKHSWGVGRHYQGSQVFDYWRDPSGSAVEYYADGDRMTSSHHTGYAILNVKAQHQWGPEASFDFISGGGNPFRLIYHILQRLWRNLVSEDDLSLTRLIKIIEHTRR